MATLMDTQRVHHNLTSGWGKILSHVLSVMWGSPMMLEVHLAPYH